MNQYDVIVIGCNVSSLISALSLLNDGYKVLLVDKRNTIGEITNNTRIGRYNFKYGFNNLYLRNNTFNYSLNKVLDTCGVKDRLDFDTIDNLCSIRLKDKEYILPFGIDTFINYLDKEIENSKDKLDKLFSIAKVCRDAIDYIVTNKDNIDFNLIKKEYSEFNYVAYLSLEEGLNRLGIDNILKEILTKLCIYYGSDSNNISYVEYLVFLINLVERGVQVPKDDLLNLLLNDYISRDGKIRLKTKVVSLIIDDEIVNGIRIDSGEVIYANKVIVDSNIANVYGNMIEQKDVPRIALKHINKRESGNKVLSIYLGLNIDVKEFNIHEYLYLFDNCIVTIDSNVSLEDDISIMSIHYVLKDNVFIESITNRNYYFTIDRKVKKIIEEIEHKMDINIFDYIEEIKVVSPFNQDVFENKLNINEGIVPRILNSNNERYIKGLYVCSGLNGDIYGYRSNIVSGLGAINYYKNEGDLSEKI